MPGWPIHFAGEQKPFEGGVFVQADSDPELEVLFMTPKASKRVHLMNHDGTYLPGWPLVLPAGASGASGPSFADVDGDGAPDVVACSHNPPSGTAAWTFAFRTDGSLLPGFPARSFGDLGGSPTVADLDDDGRSEIIVGERDWPLGRVYVFGSDGQPRPGWPVELDQAPLATASAADVDGDGMLEVIYESFTSLYVLRIDGTPLPGFPFTPPNGFKFSFSSATVADVDHDGEKEIAFGTHDPDGAGNGTVFLLDSRGTILPGWPAMTQWWVYTPPTFADLDGDGTLEVLAGDTIISASPICRAYAWHLDGSAVSGWPIHPLFALNAQMAVSDFDGDGMPEVIWDHNGQQTDGTGRLYAYHADGTPVRGWPVRTQGSPLFNPVATADVDLDGDVEIFATTGSLTTRDMTAYLWTFPGPASGVQMPMHLYNPGRTGEYRAPSVVDTPSTVEEAAVSRLRVYPNPFRRSAAVRWQLSNAEPAHITIQDVQGRTLREIRIPQGAMHGSLAWDGMDRNGLPVAPGIYFLRLGDRHEERATRISLVP
jgi:hypothetical protein